MGRVRTRLDLLRDCELAKHDDITLEEVHQALSSMPGLLADAVINSREER